MGKKKTSMTHQSKKAWMLQVCKPVIATSVPQIRRQQVKKIKGNLWVLNGDEKWSSFVWKPKGESNQKEEYKILVTSIWGWKVITFAWRKFFPFTLCYSSRRKCLSLYKTHQHSQCSIFVHKNRRNVPNFQKKHIYEIACLLFFSVMSFYHKRFGLKGQKKIKIRLLSTHTKSIPKLCSR